MSDGRLDIKSAPRDGRSLWLLDSAADIFFQGHWHEKEGHWTCGFVEWGAYLVRRTPDKWKPMTWAETQHACGPVFMMVGADNV